MLHRASRFAPFPNSGSHFNNNKRTNTPPHHIIVDGRKPNKTTITLSHIRLPNETFNERPSSIVIDCLTIYILFTLQSLIAASYPMTIPPPLSSTAFDGAPLVDSSSSWKPTTSKKALLVDHHHEDEEDDTEHTSCCSSSNSSDDEDDFRLGVTNKNKEESFTTASRRSAQRKQSTMLSPPQGISEMALPGSLWKRASRRFLKRKDTHSDSSSSLEHEENSSQEAAAAATDRGGCSAMSRNSTRRMEAGPSRKKSSLVLAPQHQQQTITPRQTPLRRHQTWYYSSNHVLVNRERLAHGLPPLTRSVALDETARQVAEGAAQGESLSEMLSHTRTFQSGNVLVGDSIRTIHGQTLARSDCQRERKNLLHPDYTHLGVGTYKDPSTGLLYLCQLFGSTQSSF